MKLDEVEKLAADVVGYSERFGVVAEIYNGALSERNITDLARAVLAMLPVVRAAEAWSRPGCNTKGFECDGCERCRAAHDQLLAELRKVGAK